LIAQPDRGIGSPTGASRAYKTLHFPLTRILVGSIVCVVIPFLLKKLLFVPLVGLLRIGADGAKFTEHSLSIVAIFAVYYFFFKHYERRNIDELSIKRFVPDTLSGFFSGFLSISLVIGILYVFGYYLVDATNAWSVLLLPLAAITLFALVEEIVFRGIMYRITEDSLGTVLALLITSLPFGIFHIFNDYANVYSILGATLLGFLLGILYTLTRSLWVPVFVHAGWNYAQVVFVSNVSSVTDYKGLFESRLEGPSLLVGGRFGIEDSIITIVLLIVLCGVVSYWSWRKGRIKQPFWKRHAST
jgi:membrane protease YdiL (CAAX protease family)